MAYPFGYTKNDFVKAQEVVLRRKKVMDAAFARRKTKWDEDYAYYQSEPDTPGNANDANMFVPRTREIVETIQPRMAGDFLNVSRPFVAVVPRKPEDEHRAKTVENWLFFRMHEMNLSLELLPYILQVLIYGSTVGKICPDDRTPWKARGSGNRGTWDVFLPIDLYNYRIDPGATCHDDAHDEAEINCVTWEEFEADSKKYKYVNTDKVKKGNYDKQQKSDTDREEDSSATENDGADREVQYYNWYGPRPDPREDDVNPETGEIIKKRKGELVITLVRMANEVVVYMKPDPHGNRRSPFVFDRFEVPPFQIYGTGIPRMLRAYQKMLNELRNLKLNFAHRCISPMVIVREGSLINKETALRWGPWRIINVRTGEPIGNAIMFWSPAAAGSAMTAMLETSELEKDIQGRAAVPDYVRGMVGELSTQTATAFYYLLSGATNKLTFNFQKMAEASLKNLAILILEHDQQSLWARFEEKIARENLENATNEELEKAAEEVTEKLWVLNRTLGEDRAREFAEISYRDLLGEYDFFPHVDPQQTYQQMVQEKLVQAIPVLLALDEKARENALMGVGNEVLNPAYLMKKLAEKLDLSEGEVVVQVPPPQATPSLPGGGGQPPPGSPGTASPPTGYQQGGGPIGAVKQDAMELARGAGVPHA